jgi:mannose-6-phosphate isomerase-like protein (cupin superfamily)
MELGWIENLHEITEKNTNFRTVLWTGENSQVVCMSIQPGQDIGEEVHPHVDQIIYFQNGPATVYLAESEETKKREVKVVDTGWTMIIPAGTWHNIVNTGKTSLQLYTVYAPKNHAPGTVHITKADAIQDEELNETVRLLDGLDP